MDPTGNLEGEVLVEPHRQLVDAIDVDAQGECSSISVRCHLDDERQGQDVTKGKLRHPDRALEPGPNIECPGSRSSSRSSGVSGTTPSNKIKQHGSSCSTD
jgi:hypothetical protein